MGNSPNFVYKILSIDQWSLMSERGVHYQYGSELDKRDGYLHLSTSIQVNRVAMKYFPELKEGILLVLNYSDIHSLLKWEPNSKGELFPHAYGVLPNKALVRVLPFSSGSFDYQLLSY